MVVGPREEPTRFDYVLSGMGVSLACGGVAGVTSTVPLALAGGAASVVAAAVLFVGTIDQY